MTDHQSTAPSPRRLPLQRAIAARYDGFHALLVRVVHPLCFATFALTVSAALAGAVYALLNVFGDDGSYSVVAVVFALVSLAAAFLFVLTPLRAVIGIVVLGGWTAALALVDDVPAGLLWAIVAVATVSVVVQVGLLVRVVPQRWRNGLMHLLVPATIGTLVGAAPVVVVVLLLLDGATTTAANATAAACGAGCVVLAVLLGLHRFGNAGDRAVLDAFAERHGLATRGATDTVPAGIVPLVPKFANQPPWRSGTVDGRTVAVATGYTATAQADLPSLHLTAVSVSMPAGGRDVWVRRRSWVHDNVLASLGRSEVVEFESIRLSEEFTIRFPAGTGELDAFLAFGPDVVDLLERGLGEAQACRIGSTLVVFVVGGALDPDELDRMLDTALRLAPLLERADARERVDTPEPAPT